MRSEDKIWAKQAKARDVAELRTKVARRAHETGEDHAELLESLRALQAEHLGAAHRAEDALHVGPARARERTVAQANLAAADTQLIRSKLAEVRDGAVARAAKKLVSAEGRLSDSDFASFLRAAQQAVGADHLADELATLEERHQSTARVLHEPGAYDVGSPHSWIRDSLAISAPGAVDQGAQERLLRHGRDVAQEIRKRSAYGQRAAKMVAEQFRSKDRVENEKRATAEVRALTTGGGTTASAAGGGAAAFVPPAILTQAWATYRSPYAAFCDQLDHSVEMPPYGLEVYVPIVSAGTSVTTQTEGSGVAEADPTTAFVSSAVVTKAGQVTLSQAVLDRVGPGITGDRLIWQQLKDQLASQTGSYAIAQALAGAQSVTNTGTFALATASGVGGFLGDLRKAKNLLHDTAGVRLRGTHCFAVGDFTDYLAAYADAQGRPVFSPTLDDNRLPLRSVGDPDGEGYTGYIVSGLALFADDNIPAASGNVQIIVCRPDSILQLEGEPVPYVFAEGALAGSLEAVVGVREYCATVPRYPSGVAVISGAAYVATTFA